jgi:hypothetical protein
VYSAVGVVVQHKGAFKALKNSLSLFEKRPLVMSFFSLLLLLFMGTSLCFIIVTLPYSFIFPGLELIVSPLSLAYYFLMAYVFTLIIASVLSSYQHLSFLL